MGLNDVPDHGIVKDPDGNQIETVKINGPSGLKFFA